jgi:hypothetical protein
MSEFDWLRNLFSGFPEPPKIRKTIFDIAGFPRWENVNSNTLSFYLDENEEHGFGRLFFNSLLQLLIEKNAIAAKSIELYQTDYTVEREFYADTKRIDILLKSTEDTFGDTLWAFIIENKLTANVYNDLNYYWQSIKAKYKTGVVISINDNRNELKQFEKSKGVKFYNILHEELVNSVLSQMPAFYLLSDDRHLLILKDYFQNISNMTQSRDYVLLEKQWKSYRQYADEIEKLRDLETQLKEYTVKCFFSAMDHFGFYPATSYTNTKSKHFFANKEFFDAAGLDYPQYFRFYFWFEDIVSYSSISIYFELYGSYTKFGPTIKEKLRSVYTPPHSFAFGINGGVNSDYYHLVVNDHLLFSDERPLEQQLILILQQVFFNSELNVVQLCTKWVKAEL